jgi:cyclophilin family peptidyl-prolyl cis-trans isomerase
VLAQLLKQFPEDLRVVYRHFPLVSIHDKALLATQAAEAAGKQGKFWLMHDLLFVEFQNWSRLPVAEFTPWLLEKAPLIGLDMEQFEADLTSEEIVAFAQKAWEDGQAIGFPGTPFVVINNNPYDGPVDLTNLGAIIALTKLKDQQFTACPPMVIDPLKNYVATIETEKGDIMVELFADVAPLAVNSFVFLAQNGWFDGITFHRVIAGFVAQAGDPTGTGLGGPGYAFRNEISSDLTFDNKGLLAMANAGADTNGSQFFITYAATPHLNDAHAVFGKVVEGMDVVKAITARDPAKGGPPGDKIISVEIVEK